jgi:putative phosphoribosyl transferase
MHIFRNRVEAGRQLALRLGQHSHLHENAVVIGLPRGGVPVAAEVARGLNLPLDIQVVRKIGLPEQPEIAMGAISGDVQVLDHATIQANQVDDLAIDRILAHERTELMRRETLYRRHRPPLDVRGKTVLLIDDGIAKGLTIMAAILAIKARMPARIIVAAPVAATETYVLIEHMPEVDECVCVLRVQNLVAIAMWYEDFSQTSDLEVVSALESCST